MSRGAHFRPVPPLPTPAMPLGINDAGTGATAAFVILHV